MQTLMLDIPDNVQLNKDEASMILASKLYEQGKFSIGQGADIAGLSERIIRLEF